MPVRRLAHGRGLELPRAATTGSAGLDLRAAIAGELVLEPGERVRLPTGLAFQIPAGWEGQVRPRSGLADRWGLAMVNAPGTVDSDYRGEVSVLLINLGGEPVVLKRGDRIAQLVFARVGHAELVEVERIGPSDRGKGGFGSSGRD